MIEQLKKEFEIVGDLNEEDIFAFYDSQPQEKKEKISTRKNLLLLELLKQRLQKESFCEIKVPGNNCCPSCLGLSFFPVIGKIELMISCHACDGTGWKIWPCNRCDGTGMKDGVSCVVCKQHPGKYIFKQTARYEGKSCDNCRPLNEKGNPDKNAKQGTGLEKKIVNVVIGIDTCRSCSGTGRNRNAESNPVLPEDIANKLFGSLKSIIIKP
jgi:hypothetical protein